LIVEALIVEALDACRLRPLHEGAEGRDDEVKAAASHLSDPAALPDRSAAFS